MKEQKYTVTVGGIDVEVTKKRMKSLRLCVHPDGRVTASAPYFVSRTEVEKFVLSRLDWIKAKKAAAAVGTDEAESRLFGEKADALLTDAQKRELLREYIASRMPYFEDMTGLSCADFSIRDMRTRWGSCTVKTGKMRFALNLITRPRDEIDYVILHELIHIRCHGHGADFKAEMDKYMPDWRERRARMRK